MDRVMKENEAPNKIYAHKSQYWGLMANESNITKNGIEYSRTDAFIEKAWDWIEDNLLSANQQDKSRLYFEQFVNYMKGE